MADDEDDSFSNPGSVNNDSEDEEDEFYSLNGSKSGESHSEDEDSEEEPEAPPAVPEEPEEEAEEEAEEEPEAPPAVPEEPEEEAEEEAEEEPEADDAKSAIKDDAMDLQKKMAAQHHRDGIAFHFTAADQRVYLLFVQRLYEREAVLLLLDVQFERYYELEPAVCFLDDAWQPLTFTVEDFCRSLLFTQRRPRVTDGQLIVYDVQMPPLSKRAASVYLHEVARPLALRALAEHVTRLQRYALTLEWSDDADESAQLLASCSMFAGYMLEEDGVKKPLLCTGTGDVMKCLKDLLGRGGGAPAAAGGGPANNNGLAQLRKKLTEEADKLQELQKDNEALQEKVTNQTNAISNLKDANAACEAEKEAQNQRIQKLENEKTACEAEKETQNQQIKQLQDEKTAYEAEKETQNQQIKQLQDEKTAYEAEKEAKNQQIEQLKDEKTACEAEKEAKNQQIKQLQDEKTACEAEKETQNQQIKQLQDENTQKDQRIQELQDEKDNLSKNAGDHGETIEILQKQLHDVRQQNNDLQTQLQDQVHKITHLQADKKRDQKIIEEQSASNKLLDNSVNDLRRSNEALHEQIANLVEKNTELEVEKQAQDAMLFGIRNSQETERGRKVYAAFNEMAWDYYDKTHRESKEVDKLYTNSEDVQARCKIELWQVQQMIVNLNEKQQIFLTGQYEQLEKAAEVLVGSVNSIETLASNCPPDVRHELLTNFYSFYKDSTAMRRWKQMPKEDTWDAKYDVMSLSLFIAYVMIWARSYTKFTKMLQQLQKDWGMPVEPNAAALLDMDLNLFGDNETDALMEELDVLLGTSGALHRDTPAPTTT